MPYPSGNWILLFRQTDFRLLNAFFLQDRICKTVDCTDGYVLCNLTGIGKDVILHFSSCFDIESQTQDFLRIYPLFFQDLPKSSCHSKSCTGSSDGEKNIVPIWFLNNGLLIPFGILSSGFPILISAPSGVNCSIDIIPQIFQSRFKY